MHSGYMEYTRKKDGGDSCWRAEEMFSCADTMPRAEPLDSALSRLC